MMFSVGVGQMIYEDSINRSSEFQFLFKKKLQSANWNHHLFLVKIGLW